MKDASVQPVETAQKNFLRDVMTVIMILETVVQATVPSNLTLNVQMKDHFANYHQAAETE